MVFAEKRTVGIWVTPVTLEFHPGHIETIHGPEQALHYLLIRWPSQRGPRYEQACMMNAMCVEGQGGCEQAREAFIAAAIEANVFSIGKAPPRHGSKDIREH